MNLQDLLKEQESVIKDLRITNENLAVLTIRKHELQDQLRKIQNDIKQVKHETQRV